MIERRIGIFESCKSGAIFLGLHLPSISMVEETVRLCGCFRILFLYDVAEAIDLEKLRDLLGTRGGPLERPFPRRTPEHVRFEHRPILEPVEPLLVGVDAKAACTMKYYSFGVIVVQVEIPFESDWNSLLPQGSRWMDASDIEEVARTKARQHLDGVETAVLRPNKDWLAERYLVTELHEIQEGVGAQMTAAELLDSHGAEIVQLVRGETLPLSPKGTEEALQAGLSYYSRDLIVVGANGAVVYDRPEDANATAQILEFAKMQLLEFRYYDRLMTRVLSNLYDALEQKRNFLLSRWSLPREAQHFNTIRLDVMELTERVDNAIKFVSDAYYARVYRLAATRIGVPEYRQLVDEKLSTAADLTGFMVDQFNEARSFFLEVGVAILALLDVILLLRGK
jgi:hypothetical protein